MKTPAFLPIFLSILFCVCGCGTQKQTSGNYIEIGRPDIVEAVRTGRFKIELTEALSEKGVPRDAFDSYVLVDGKHVELRISPSLMRRSLRERIHTDYHDAKMEDFHIRKKRICKCPLHGTHCAIIEKQLNLQLMKRLWLKYSFF